STFLPATTSLPSSRYCRAGRGSSGSCATARARSATTGYLAPNAGFFGGVTTEGDRAGQIAMQRLFRLESEVELRDADDRRIQVKAFDALGTNPDPSTAIVVSITFPDT